MFSLSPLLFQSLSTPKTYLTPKRETKKKKKKKKLLIFFIIIILNKTTEYREDFTSKALSFRDSRWRS